MKKPVNVKLILLIVLGLTSSAFGLATAIAGDAEEVREEFHHSYPLSANGRVSLHNVAGIVRITAWEKNEVKVDAVKRAPRRPQLAEAEIKVENTADSVRIWTKYPDNSRMDFDDREPFDQAASVDYSLSIPRGARLDSVELVAGSLDIVGVTGGVRASTVNGHLKASGLAGDVKLSTVNGTLEASFDRESGPITLNSVSGALILSLPSDALGEIRANTLSGPITNDFGLEARTGSYVGHELHGQLGSGGNQIKLNTVSGRITIQHANDGKSLSQVSSLLSKRGPEATAARVRMRHPPSEEWLKAQRDLMQAQAELRRIESGVRIETRTVMTQALVQAERNLTQARAELQRVQSSPNSDGQQAAARALAEAERELSQVRAELQRNQAQANNDALRQRSIAIAGTERKVAQAQAELQRVQSQELARSQVEAAKEVSQARLEASQVQREMQERIRVERRDEVRLQREKVRSQARSVSLQANAIPGYGLRFGDSESKTLSVGDKPRITLGTFDGRVSIHAWDKSELTYKVRKATIEESALKGITLRSDQKGQEVLIVADLDEAYVHRLAGAKSVTAFASMEVWVPRGATVRASTGEGSMTIEGVAGDINLRNSSGSITANDCKGRLTANAGSGRVQVSNFDGELNALAGLGGIHLSGRFTQLSAQTNNEPIYLDLASDTNAFIETNSSSVVNEGSVAAEETGTSGRVRRFKVGTGGPLFTLRSGEGRIVLRRTGAGPM